MKSKLFRLFALLVVVSMVTTPAFAQTHNPPTINPTAQPTDKIQAVSPDEIVKLDEPATFVVFFEGQSLVARAGGAEQLNAASVDSTTYLKTLAANREQVLSQVAATLGRKLEVQHVYDVILNAAAITMTQAEADKLAGLPGVSKVLRDTVETITTDSGPTWIGAPTLWDGSAVPDGTMTKGEGVVAGILDTGINFDHPSFSATPADGFVYPHPASYLGVCDPTNVDQYDPAYATACNDKIIGAYSYTRDSRPVETVTPEDSEGHGSHTASTVAGNTVDLNFYGTPLTISGVAPHAQIIAYDVCYPAPPNGACNGTDSVAAVQQAILDGVDVINYSISGGEDPYNDAVELAFLEATGAGVTVSTSAGNSGPTAATVAHRSPWLLSTAATTHNRKFTSMVNFSNPTYTNILTLAGEIPFTSDVVNAPVKWSGDVAGNLLACNAFPAGYFSGSIALIQRGTCTFSVKILNAQAAGAIGVLMYTDTRAQGPMSVSGTAIPGVMLDIPGATGTAIGNWIHGDPAATVSISKFTAVRDNAFGDIMGSFSSRGPDTTLDVLKPDIAAPGVEILAAVSDGTIAPSPTAEYNLMQGTSMASPHDAGSAALLKSLHPTWTPAQIKSALMLTANNILLKEDKATPADPFDIGSGRVALQFADLTGLVMNETYAKYVAADPAVGGDVKTLNLPTFYDSKCVGSCTWTRTFTSVANMPATYTVTAPAWITVTPSTFTIFPGGTQTITITADVMAFAPDAWKFATIDFTTTDTFATILLSQGFDSTTFPPTGWTRFNLDTSTGQWARSTTTPHSGTGSAYHTYGSSTVTENGWLVSPTVTLGSSSFLNFSERTAWPADYAGGHKVFVCDTTGGTDCSTPPTNFTLLQDVPALPNTAWRNDSISLSTYAGKTVAIAFQYNALFADGWYIDDVAVVDTEVTAPISNVHMTGAVLPSASNLPTLVKFTSQREAGAATLSDLFAVAISNLTVDTYGFVKGEQTVIHLAQDPTNTLPYDDLSQVWYTVIPMDAGAARLVAETIASTAKDVDLYWGFDLNGDGKPQANEQYQASATSSAIEYLSEVFFPAPFYNVWILVQNWQGSGAALDDITLSVGNVPYAAPTPATMTVTGPTTNPAGTPFSMDVFWHDLPSQPGDRLYGLFDTYTDATYTQGIGFTQVDVIRTANDVVKTADVSSAQPGDTITYTLTINNSDLADLNYTIEDAIPAGTTYVPGSATNGAVYDAVNNKITWSGLVAGASFRDYLMTTSQTDANCSMPLANSGGYVDLQPYGLLSNSGVAGEGTWTWATTGNPINFYGVNSGNAINFTDDAFAYLGSAVANPGINADIPDAAAPNNLLAFFWRDLVISYDAATNKGVTLANLTSGGVPVAHIIEMDDVSLKSDPTKTYDTEMYISKAVSDAAGDYEAVFAYDNINGPLDLGTIGVENSTGTVGTKYAYNDAALGAITNGTAICFDYAVVPPAATVITFQVVVTDTLAPTLTNTAMHDNDALGTVPEAASVTINTPSGFPQAVDDTYSVLAGGTLTVDAANGVMANDVIASNDGRAVSLVTAPLHGKVTLTSDGSFVYIPDVGYVGADTFTYELVTYPGPLAPWTDQAVVTINVLEHTVFLPIVSR